MDPRRFQHRVGWMTPENLEKWFGLAVAQNSTEFLEVHVHSMIVRERRMEAAGIYGLRYPFEGESEEKLEPDPIFEVGVSLRDPSDRLMMYVQDHQLTLRPHQLEEFKKDLLPLTEMAKVLYEDKDPKRRK